MPKDGGWGAVEITCERLEELEHDFRHVQVVHDRTSRELLEAFGKSVLKSSNRKSTPYGEPSSEVWRILVLPEWLIPGYTPKWGVGHERKFQPPTKFQIRIQRLFDTINSVKCIPGQGVVNTTCFIPKKFVNMIQHDSVCDSQRAIHVYSAFSQNLVKAVQSFNPKDVVPPARSFGAEKHRQRE